MVAVEVVKRISVVDRKLAPPDEIVAEEEENTLMNDTMEAPVEENRKFEFVDGV